MTAVDWCGGSSCSGQLTFALVIMGLFTIERHAAGKLDRERRVTFDNLALLLSLHRGPIAVGACAHSWLSEACRLKPREVK